MTADESSGPDGPVEIELKLGLTPEAMEELIASPVLRERAQSTVRTTALHAVYYDTEDRRLRVAQGSAPRPRGGWAACPDPEVRPQGRRRLCPARRVGGRARRPRAGPQRFRRPRGPRRDGPAPARAAQTCVRDPGAPAHAGAGLDRMPMAVPPGSRPRSTMARSSPTARSCPSASSSWSCSRATRSASSPWPRPCAGWCPCGSSLWRRPHGGGCWRPASRRRR